MKPKKRKKPYKMPRPCSWSRMDRVGDLPAPYVAARFADGRIDLASIDPRRIVDVYEKSLCHLCGVDMGMGNDGSDSVILNATQLSVGFSTEPIGHFECLVYATGVCPHLRRTGPHIVATAHRISGARRPLINSAVSNYLSLLGEVRYLAIAHDGAVYWQIEVEEGEGDDPDPTTDFPRIARDALAAHIVIKQRLQARNTRTCLPMIVSQV